MGHVDVHQALAYPAAAAATWPTWRVMSRASAWARGLSSSVCMTYSAGGTLAIDRPGRWLQAWGNHSRHGNLHEASRQSFSLILDPNLGQQLQHLPGGWEGAGLDRPRPHAAIRPRAARPEPGRRPVYAPPGGASPIAIQTTWRPPCLCRRQGGAWPCTPARSPSWIPTCLRCSSISCWTSAS